MFVSRVQPVAIRKAVFSIVCSFLMLFFDTKGLHMVFAYSKMGRVIALKVEKINSYCLPHLVEVSAKRLF